MSIFGSILSSIFGTPAHAEGAPPASAPTSAPATAPASAPAGTAAPAPTSTAANAPTAAAPKAAAAPAAGAAKADVAAVLDKLTDEQDEDLEWRTSIVDLLKLLGLSSSLATRKELAKELGYTGDTKDSGKMNVWLHKQVMTKLAENGGVVPAELRD